MEQPNIKNIVISGDIGTGASTLAKKLSIRLGWEVQSTGSYVRQWFKEHNLPIEAADKIPEDVDRSLDLGFQEKMKQSEHIIFESHLGGWLSMEMNKVFKVLCTADLEERIKRVMKRDQMEKAEAISKMTTRSKLLAEKFLQLYNVSNSFDPSYFNLVVDTTNLNADQVFDYVWQALMNLPKDR